eukprot:GEMP01039491.1.p1 GENE.GEMP01039491.1~~GEMP01039491.1.p1  ORF type:complete len:456 (+),score=72.53 GEMP01039491.1:107-1474(+)
MRNIAILEWGPVLCYVSPREQILIRGWNNDGPLLPEYLSLNVKVSHVRYALSAYQNLDKVLGNLRRCFGFPYTDSIGFWNALTRKGRVRKENKHIVEKLSTWAIATNMDAIVWVDYEKTTARKGGLGFNERAVIPKPFLKSHFKIVPTYVNVRCVAHRDSDDDHDHDSSHYQPLRDSPNPPNSPNSHRAHTLEDLSLPSSPPVHVPLRLDSIVNVPAFPMPALRRDTVRVTTMAPNANPLADLAAMHLGASPFDDAPGMPGMPGMPPIFTEDLGVQGSVLQQKSVAKKNVLSKRALDAKKTVRNDVKLQEEYVPVMGSIYRRSIAPGPGYYDLDVKQRQCYSARGSSFGYKPVSSIQEIVKESRDRPGPGNYDIHEAYLWSSGYTFTCAKKYVPPGHSPFLTVQHAVKENIGTHGSGIFYDLPPPDRTLGFTVPKSRKVGYDDNVIMRLKRVESK